MKPSIQNLQKYFRLEAKNGYDNKSVIGGLARMLDAWEAQARLDEIPEDIIRLVNARIRDYGRLTEKSRAETLLGVWRRIQRGDESGEVVDGFETTATPAAQTRQDPILVSSAIESPPAEHETEPALEPVDDPFQQSAELAAAQSAPVKPASQPVDRPMTGERKPSTMDFPPKTTISPATSFTSSSNLPPMANFPSPSNLPPPVEPEALNAPLTVVKGIGPHHAKVLERVGLFKLRDMLYDFPFRYIDYSRLIPINRLPYGEDVTVLGTVKNISTRSIRGGKLKVTEAALIDGTGVLRITWFNQAYTTQKINEGAVIYVSGKVKQYLGRPVMDNPEWETLEQEQLSTGRLLPVYHGTDGLGKKWFRNKIHDVVFYWAPRVPDPLSTDLRQRAGLMSLPQALLQTHWPDSWEELKAAQERLAFDEIFLLQLGVQSQKRKWQERTARSFTSEPEWLDTRIAALPFRLTGAQRRVVDDLRQDLGTGRPMNRLIQGDVGSGKTVVAALGIEIVARTGAQAALMAPTSILAEQHYKSLLRLLAGVKPPEPVPQIVPPKPAPARLLGLIDIAAISAAHQETDADFDESDSPFEDSVTTASETTDDDEPVTDTTAEAQHQMQSLLEASPSTAAVEAAAGAEIFQAETVEVPPKLPPLLQPSEIRLMIGATPEAEKDEIRAGLADGSIKLVVGTHALIENPVAFQDLQLVIVDEQHRFGVEQRAALRSKGANPHLLVMTATPIPRSLALTVYGDLDLSVIDEMPPGRQPVDTYIVMPRERERAYTLIRSQVQQGRQAFIIYPLVEGGEETSDKAAVDEHARLQKEIFPGLTVGLLHGRMRPEDKDRVMTEFHNGRYHILVSTTVIEVGVDVPNASVMLIEGSNRFGLAQLHQLRGRVGRSAEKSYCLLIPDHPDQAENERLQVMVATTDGFVLAEKDLEQRGPGQFLGTRQAGYAELQFANLTDIRLIEKARRFAQSVFEQDPELIQPQHRLLAFALQQSWSGGQGDIS